MFISLPSIENDIHNLIQESRYNDALANMVVGVHNHYTLPEAEHKFLYYPIFDQQIQTLADVLNASDQAATPQPCGNNTLVIATEMHQVGGHSKVISDVMRELPQPTLVLTDLFWRYGKAQDQLQWILDSLDFASVIVLQQSSLWGKCRALRHLTRRLRPGSILYFNHHQDPIPFIGTLGHAGSRKTLVHHGDHHPSLGNTLAGVEHLDFAEELAQVCSKHLQRPSQVLPLYVKDAGLKQFSPVTQGRFGVVTSGTSNKFARSGPLALQDLVLTALTATRGHFFHIGPLDAQWVVEIKAHLQHHGIEAERFESLGAVASLWATLAQIDAHLYLGSAPVGGGRAAIEAQGCGYPVAFFRVEDTASALAVDSIYAHKELGWATLGELADVLQGFAAHQAQWSMDARALYETRFSQAEFARVLRAATAQTPDLPAPGGGAAA